MCKIIIKPWFQKKGLLIIFFVLGGLFICENAFSKKHWDTSLATVFFNPKEHSIEITYVFYDYYFGSFGEDGYLKTFGINFHRSMVSDKETLLKCEVEQQIFNNFSWLTMSYKLHEARLQFIGTTVPEDNSFWTDETLRVEVKNEEYQAFLGIKWFLPNDFRVDEIILFGIWQVAGLNCIDTIKDVTYPIKDALQLKKELNPISKLNYAIPQEINRYNKNSIKINKAADAVVIKGADLGKTISVYSAFGILLKSVVTNSDIVNIQLAAKQMYILNIGKERYKVVL